MADVIAQRELRNDNAEIMRRVEAGESFVVTRNGRPIADLIPHQVEEQPKRRRKLGELVALFKTLPPIDREEWERERAADDEIFGSDDIDDGPWRDEANR